MNIAKLVKSSVALILMAAVLLLTSACKKEKAQPEAKPALQGDWKELNLSAGLERLISFRSDKSFSMVVVNLVTPSVMMNTYTGTYTVTNGNVKVNITEEKVTQDKVVVSTKAVNMTLYDNGTYTVENNVLTLKYTTYPADAPVNTEAKFKRLLE